MQHIYGHKEKNAWVDEAEFMKKLRCSEHVPLSRIELIQCEGYGGQFSLQLWLKKRCMELDHGIMSLTVQSKGCTVAPCMPFDHGVLDLKGLNCSSQRVAAVALVLSTSVFTVIAVHELETGTNHGLRSDRSPTCPFHDLHLLVSEMHSSSTTS